VDAARVRIGLADELRAATALAHQAAERAAMQHLFHPNVLTRARYAAYLGGLYQVYGALEAQLDRHRDHSGLAPLFCRELLRTAAIGEDLATLLGPTWPRLPDNRAAADYVAHLAEVGTSEPGLLLAHIYTRYLGDLYGGQLLKGLLTQRLQLSGNQGVQSLLFPLIPDLVAFRAGFRARLNALSVPPSAVSALVREALHSFALAQALFESLA
jgi:heme oxygenase